MYISIYRVCFVESIYTCVYIFTYIYIHIYIYLFFLFIYLFISLARQAAVPPPRKSVLLGWCVLQSACCVGAECDLAHERTVFMQGGRSTRAPECVRSPKIVWRSSNYNFRNASNSIFQKLYQLAFSEVLTIILAEMITGFSICAKGLRTQCKIESETAT